MFYFSFHFCFPLLIFNAAVVLHEIFFLLKADFNFDKKEKYDRVVKGYFSLVYHIQSPIKKIRFMHT